jgi:phosphoglycolate phosphatase
MTDVIFDFDGTIADSFSEILNVFYEITHHNHEISQDEISHLKGLSDLEVARYLKIPLWQIPFLVIRGRRAMASHMRAVKIFPGIKDQIVSLHKNGHKLFIVSSNSQSNVNVFLTQHRIDQYFEKIYGGIGLFSKASALRKFLRQNNLRADHCIYIGDETRDIEASRRVNVRCIAVSWGFAAEDILEKLQPFALAKSPQVLTDIITKS